MSSKNLPQLKIITCTHNATDSLARCLSSLEAQTYPHFTVCIADDASTDPRQRSLIEAHCARTGWMSLFYSEQKGGLCRMVQAIQALECEDEDIICIVDGDDWLAHKNALSIVAETYAKNPSIWLTYGSFESFPSGEVQYDFYNQALPPSVISQNSFRDFPWIFCHLQTFKYFLWKKVRDEDLRDHQGTYFRVCGDRARFYPLLELAGEHIHRIADILYIYNLTNPLSHFRIRPQEQQSTLKEVLTKSPYTPLPPRPHE